MPPPPASTFAASHSKPPSVQAGGRRNFFMIIAILTLLLLSIGLLSMGSGGGGGSVVVVSSGGAVSSGAIDVREVKVAGEVVEGGGGNDGSSEAQQQRAAQQKVPPPPPPKRDAVAKLSRTTMPAADDSNSEEDNNNINANDGDMKKKAPAAAEEKKSAAAANDHDDADAKKGHSGDDVANAKGEDANGSAQNESPSSSSSPSFTTAVHAMVLEELGVELATALYDPLFLDDSTRYVSVPTSAAESSSSSSSSSSPKEPHIDPHSLFLIEKNLPWAFRTVLMSPSVPATMTTMAAKLVMLKQTTSLGIARLARDGRLAEGWEKGDAYGSFAAAGSSPSSSSSSSASANVMRKVYSRPIRAAIAGFASYAVSFLQVLIDGEKRMPDLVEWAKLQNNLYSRVVREEEAKKKKTNTKNSNGDDADEDSSSSYKDVKDPIVHPHLDPLINLLQVIRVGPAASTAASSSSFSSSSDDDATVKAILAQSKRMRAAAEGVLSKALGAPVGEEGDGLSTTTAEQQLGDKYAAYLQSNTAPPTIFMGVINAFTEEGHAKKKRHSVEDEAAAGGAGASSPATVLLDVLGYATLVWNNRMSVLDSLLEKKAVLIAPSASSSSSSYSSSSSALTNRAQYALQYFSNSDYGRWNKYLVNGRFWNSIRPVIGCSALMKLCEEPDGCRYLCNLNYLLLATPKMTEGLRRLTSSSSSSSSLQYAHQAVGFGSNNEYDWELGMVDAFKRAAPAGGSSSSDGGGRGGVAEFTFPNTIGRITVFDCTLKQWTPPSFLTEGKVGFGHASYCLGLKDVSPLPGIREAKGDGRDGVAVVGFPSLRKFINSDGIYPSNYFEEGGGAANSAAGRRPPNPFLHRYPVRGAIAKNPNTTVVKHHTSSSSSAGDASSSDAADDVIIPSPLYVDYTTFDEVSILKLDVEGFEHSAFPSFLRSELQDLSEHYTLKRLMKAKSSNSERKGQSSSSSSSPLITFDLDAPDSPTISQLGMEFHRHGHKGLAGASYAGALRSHYSLMQLYAKGFLMFAQEKNPVDYCCYEIAMAHYRHFVRSEVWMTMR